MDEIQKLNYEIGRLKGEKNRMIGRINTLYDLVSDCKPNEESIGSDFLKGWFEIFLASYKKEE